MTLVRQLAPLMSSQNALSNIAVPVLTATVESQVLDVRPTQNSSSPNVSELLKTAKMAADGNWYPPSYLPKTANEAMRVKAGFIVLVRNEELEKMKDSMQDIEGKFNKNFGYPWIFLNDKPFTEHFKSEITKMTSSEVRFGLVPKEHWSYPDWISQEKAAETRRKASYIYGKSESYRHMCRYQSGFFFRHPLTLDLDFYWRVEPGIKLHCRIDYDPFVFMAINNKTYGFTIAPRETPGTVTTLYQTTKNFFKEHPDYIHKRAATHFLTNGDSSVDKIMDSRWNLCHFWSNFEIGDLRFYRSKEYLEYFDYLDKAGGFFYERWGDAPIHTFAAALMQDKAKVHHFDDIGYYHPPWGHCPRNKAYHNSGRCDCDPVTTFDYNGYSCLRNWWKGADEKTPVYVVPRTLQV